MYAQYICIFLYVLFYFFSGFILYNYVESCHVLHPYVSVLSTLCVLDLKDMCPNSFLTT